MKGGACRPSSPLISHHRLHRHEVRAEIPAEALTRAVWQPGLAQGFVLPISDKVAAIMFDEPGAAPEYPRPRLRALVDGEPLSPPLISTSLALRGGGRRHLLIGGRSAAWLAGRAIVVSLGARRAAAIDPSWLQPPLTDGAALIDGLSDEGRRRLLKLFLATGASLFGFREASSSGTRRVAC